MCTTIATINNKNVIDPIVASDDNGSETTDAKQKKEQTKLLWTRLGRSKARKPGYNQAGKYKTRQGNTGGLERY